MSVTLIEQTAASNVSGYRSFKLGSFEFVRDEYFAHITWPSKAGPVSHVMSADAFLRALMRDIAWGFFYGTVNFDHVIGTRNLYGRVELFAGRYNDVYHSQGLDLVEVFETPLTLKTFKAILADWTNAGFDPFAAPQETGTAAFGRKHGDNRRAIERDRVSSRRMVGLPGDTPLRTDENGYPVNRAFLDVPQDEPEINAEPGFEDEVHAVNLFAYLSRSDVTWNPSVSSVCKHSLFCPTTEEYVLPIIHGNDRIEWFLQLSDEIEWDIKDKETGRPRARAVMKAGDVCCMPADISHQGFSPKRSMLLVWENADPTLPKRFESGELSPYPADF